MTTTAILVNPTIHPLLLPRQPSVPSGGVRFHLTRLWPHYAPSTASPAHHRRSLHSNRSGDEQPNLQISLVSATATSWKISWNRSKAGWRRRGEGVPSTRPRLTYVPPWVCLSPGGMFADFSGIRPVLGFAPESTEPQNQDLTTFTCFCVYLSTF